MRILLDFAIISAIIFDTYLALSGKQQPNLPEGPMERQLKLCLPISQEGKKPLLRDKFPSHARVVNPNIQNRHDMSIAGKGDVHH